MTPFLIAGARVIDPSRQSDGVADVLVVDGRIEAVGRNVPAPEGARRIDGTGKVVATADVPEIPRDVLYRLKK